MPLFPTPAAGTAAMPGAIYSALADKIAQIDGPIFPLHVGDAFMEPLEGARLENQTVAKHRWGMHKYTRPQGHAPLIDALVDKCRSRNRLPVERAGITVTAGATAGLAAVMGALCNPGDEVLILVPFFTMFYNSSPVYSTIYSLLDFGANLSLKGVSQMLHISSIRVWYRGCVCCVKHHPLWKSRRLRNALGQVMTLRKAASRVRMQQDQLLSSTSAARSPPSPTATAQSAMDLDRTPTRSTAACGSKET